MADRWSREERTSIQAAERARFRERRERHLNRRLIVRSEALVVMMIIIVVVMTLRN